MNRIIQGQTGFSLVGVLFAMAMTGILMLVLSTMIVTANQSRADLDLRLELSQITSSLLAIVSDSDVCRESFANGQRLPAGELSSYGWPLSVTMPSGLLKEGASLEGNRLVVNKFRMMDIQHPGLDEDGNEIYYGRLIYNLGSTRPGVISFRDREISVVVFKVNSTSGNIVGCGAAKAKASEQPLNTLRLNLNDKKLSPNLNGPSSSDKYL